MTQEAPQQPPEAEVKQEAGNVPPPASSARDGPGEPAKEWPRITLARGADGKLYNPAKGPKQPESAPKTATPADLKPLPVRTYDESADSTPSQKGGIDGLGTIPKGWPELAANVSLGQEIAWVQSERLRVVKEQATGRIKVDLSKARVPAPSMAALSWLETSIRSYAKFVEVASKQASSGQDEAEFVRRERMALGEIRSILGEMLVDKQG